ncbi:MmgE/PrpD family protein [Paraburkholderia aromaticivorans]|uniref:MmgE/PrpD family protein n=1 Tax=Paraburkholderia aromaticivorans TaxID=2026199 RepID=UPI0014560A51|nr:MmgE/PrpD family protein [Paraburkholderia aromaticivorans]
MTILEQFGEYVAQQYATELRPETLHAAKRVLIDWFSALLPGTQTAPSIQLLQAHRGELGYGRSSLPGSETTAFAPTAAWINGSTSHAVEFDDIFRDAVYHPGCPTIAAALALAEETQASGLSLLKSIVAGYEVSTRIGAAIQPAHYRFFHTTGTVGCFGASAAGVTLSAPGDGKAALHAMATSATFASGLQQAFRSDAMTKALHAGHAAWVGVTAAQGAAAGITGVADILEGKAGFGAALCDSPDWSTVTDGLGTTFNIERITQKNHGCCGHTFAAIDALLEALSQNQLRWQQISRITVRTYAPALDVAGIREPGSAFEARFSMPYVLGHAAVYGSVRLEAFTEKRLWDNQVRELMKKVELVADPELTHAFPKMRAARVELLLLDGRTIEVFAPHRRGDPESPLSDDDINEKFIELAEPVIGSQAAATMLANLWRMDELGTSDLHLADLLPQGLKRNLYYRQ